VLTDEIMYLTIFGLLTVCFLFHIGKETYIFIPQPHFLGRLRFYERRVAVRGQGTVEEKTLNRRPQVSLSISYKLPSDIKRLQISHFF